MFPTASCFSLPSEFKTNSNFPSWKQCKHFTPMDSREAGLTDVCAHLGLYEDACASSQGLPLDWTKRWIFFSLVWEINRKLYWLEAHAQHHALEVSNFAAWKNPLLEVCTWLWWLSIMSLPSSQNQTCQCWLHAVGSLSLLQCPFPSKPPGKAMRNQWWQNSLERGINMSMY